MTLKPEINKFLIVIIVFCDSIGAAIITFMVQVMQNKPNYDEIYNNITSDNKQNVESGKKELLKHKQNIAVDGFIDENHSLPNHILIELVKYELKNPKDGKLPLLKWLVENDFECKFSKHCNKQKIEDYLASNMYHILKTTTNQKVQAYYIAKQKQVLEYANKTNRERFDSTSSEPTKISVHTITNKGKEKNIEDSEHLILLLYKYTPEMIAENLHNVVSTQDKEIEGSLTGLTPEKLMLYYDVETLYNLAEVGKALCKLEKGEKLEHKKEEKESRYLLYYIAKAINYLTSFIGFKLFSNLETETVKNNTFDFKDWNGVKDNLDSVAKQHSNLSTPLPDCLSENQLDGEIYKNISKAAQVLNQRTSSKQKDMEIN